jgi:hypothetical protein
MSTRTLDDLVRDQILAGGPDEYDGVCMTYPPTQKRYIDDILDSMTNAELLSLISDALWEWHEQ